MTLRCYILDDEQQAIDALAAMLEKKFADRVTVAGKTTDPQIALTTIDELKPDLLFLDMEMPQMNGIELLSHFPNRNFEVIVCTAHTQFAISALKAATIDYLIKPLSPKEVFDAIQKVEERVAGKKMKTGIGTGKILLPSHQSTIVVNIQDITRIEGHNNYSHFFFVNRPKLIVSRTLKDFEEQLSSQDFFRVHQSHLINLQQVESIESTDGDHVIMKQGDRVEISRRKKTEFLERIRNL